MINSLKISGRNGNGASKKRQGNFIGYFLAGFILFASATAIIGASFDVYAQATITSTGCVADGDPCTLGGMSPSTCCNAASNGSACTLTPSGTSVCAPGCAAVNCECASYGVGYVCVNDRCMSPSNAAGNPGIPGTDCPSCTAENAQSACALQFSSNLNVIGSLPVGNICPNTLPNIIDYYSGSCHYCCSWPNTTSACACNNQCSTGQICGFTSLTCITATPSDPGHPCSGTGGTGGCSGTNAAGQATNYFNVLLHRATSSAYQTCDPGPPISPSGVSQCEYLTETGNFPISGCILDEVTGDSCTDDGFSTNSDSTNDYLNCSSGFAPDGNALSECPASNMPNNNYNSYCQETECFNCDGTPVNHDASGNPVNTPLCNYGCNSGGSGGTSSIPITCNQLYNGTPPGGWTISIPGGMTFIPASGSGGTGGASGSCLAVGTICTSGGTSCCGGMTCNASGSASYCCQPSGSSCTAGPGFCCSNVCTAGTCQ